MRVPTKRGARCGRASTASAASATTWSSATCTCISHMHEHIESVIGEGAQGGLCWRPSTTGPGHGDNPSPSPPPPRTAWRTTSTTTSSAPAAARALTPPSACASPTSGGAPGGDGRLGDRTLAQAARSVAASAQACLKPPRPHPLPPSIDADMKEACAEDIQATCATAVDAMADPHIRQSVLNCLQVGPHGRSDQPWACRADGAAPSGGGRNGGGPTPARACPTACGCSLGREGTGGKGCAALRTVVVSGGSEGGGDGRAGHSAGASRPSTPPPQPPPQSFKAELRSDRCRDKVVRQMMRAARNINFNDVLAQACQEDRAKYCQGVQPVRGER